MKYNIETKENEKKESKNNDENKIEDWWNRMRKL